MFEEIESINQTINQSLNESVGQPFNLQKAPTPQVDLSQRHSSSVRIHMDISNNNKNNQVSMHRTSNTNRSTGNTNSNISNIGNTNDSNESTAVLSPTGQAQPIPARATLVLVRTSLPLQEISLYDLQ